MQLNLGEFSTHELLVTFSMIMEELKARHVVRTFNNPVADYCEALAAFALSLRLEGNSHKGYDATDLAGTKYQIKGRLIHDAHSLNQLGIIRNLDAHELDYLIAVLLDPQFSVIEAYKIPHSLVTKYSQYSELQHGNIIRLRGPILEDHGIKKIGNALRVELPNQSRNSVRPADPRERL